MVDDREFEYALNAMEGAALHTNPSQHDYEGKRKRVFALYDALRLKLAERDKVPVPEEVRIMIEDARVFAECWPDPEEAPFGTRYADMLSSLSLTLAAAQDGLGQDGARILDLERDLAAARLAADQANARADALRRLLADAQCPSAYKETLHADKSKRGECKWCESRRAALAPEPTREGG
jgi:outer membrane murein-binding lipoprotein Lpp